jgi:ParB family chromosome partitioning protein
LVEAEKYELQEIDVNLIEIGPGEARSRKVEENTDLLAESIDRIGLLHPITVWRTDEGKFELIAGQRRLIAVKKLEWDKIPAKVVPRPDEVKAKAISLAENSPYLRYDLSRADAKDAALLLYHRVGSARAVSKTLGIPYDEILDLVKYERLHDDLKKMVDEGKVEVNDAVKAQDFSTLPDRSIDIEKAKKLAPEMKILGSEQKREARRIHVERPSITAEEFMEEVRKPVAVKEYRLPLELRIYEPIMKFAKDEGVSELEAVATLIEEGLKSRGYLPKE